jgi:hypothetical protein
MRYFALLIIVLISTGCASCKSKADPQLDMYKFETKDIKEPATQMKPIVHEKQTYDPIFKPKGHPTTSMPRYAPRTEESVPTPVSVQVAQPIIPKVYKPVKVITKDRDYEEVRLGNIEDDIPAKMKVGDKVVVTVKITNDIKDKSTKSTELPVSSDMKVELKYDKKDFIVDNRSAEIQKVDARFGKSIWSFDVTPIRSGKRVITVEASMVFKSIPKVIPISRKEVIVDSSPWYSMMLWSAKNFDKIMGILGSGGFISVVTWLIKRRQKQLIRSYKIE